MAKISINKLKLNKDYKKININWNEEIDIEVKQYLPVNEKLELISHIVNMAHDEQYNFCNPVKLEVYASLYILKYYTNINFTEKQLEDADKTYDLLNYNEVIDKVVAGIPKKEYQELMNGIEQTIKSIYEYQNSVLGILDTIGEDYSNLNYDVEKIQKEIADPDNMKFLKEVLTKLG